MTVVDIAIVIAFFLGIFAIGLYERKRITVDDYWVNSRRTNKFVLVATTTSTFLGVGSLVSNAGVAFSGGGLATLMFMASFFLYFLVFAKFFAPRIKEFGDRTGAYSVPDYLEARYSLRTRIAGTIVNLITYGLYLALQILGFGIFLGEIIPGLGGTLATLLGGAIVVAYTAVGGLRADIRTDIVQFCIMLSLIIVFLPVMIFHGGGLGVIADLPLTYLAGQEFAPWYVYVAGTLLLGASTLVSADLWQRAYAGDTRANVRWAMQWSGVIVFLFLTAGTLFGIFGRILVPDASANTVIPELLRAFLAPPFFGIVLAGFFAAIMSSADTVLLIMSMTLVHDLYQKSLGRKITKEQFLSVSRWTTFMLGIIAVTVAIFIGSVVHLAIDAVSFTVALLPAIVFGFFGKKPSERAAFWSIVMGTLTIALLLPILPIEAFIPGTLVSFSVFLAFDHMSEGKKTLRNFDKYQ